MNAVAAAQAKGWRHVYFNWLTLPFWGIHVLAIVGLAIVGFSWRGVLLCAALYAPRMFFVTGIYHRYFSHRTYKTSRWFQLVLAVCATTTSQKGPLWWAAHHRVHHKLSDQPGDLHSVVQSGFWWSHMGWILARDLEGTDLSKIKDFAKYPELRWLDKYWALPPVALGTACALLGGLWGLTWFAVSQMLLWHGTFTINSLSHLWGSRRYATGDDSRNNFALAIVTLGEGWHNNHHHYQVAARNGFFWWEIDPTYYTLRALAALRLIRDLHGVPDHILDDVSPATAAEEAEPAAMLDPV